MRTVLLFILFVIHFKSFTQHEKIHHNWKTISLKDKHLGTVDYHIYNKGIDKRKALIVHLEGSGNFPLFYLNPNGRYSTSTTLNFDKISNDYHILLISKPNIPLVDSIKVAPSGRKYYPTNDIYRQMYSLDWRVNATDKAIEDALKKLNVDTEKIIVWGHSEGAQVAPAVAVKNKHVTHVVAIMGNALNHLYDFILSQRLAAKKGEITNETAQKHIDSLYVEFEKIFKAPNSTSKEWYGETYYKWSSFASSPPIENMLKLDIPILYIAGGADENQNVINMDYAKLEFIRKGKNNLTYKVFPNLDHFFLETRTHKSGKKEWIDHFDYINTTVIDWLVRKQ